MNVKLLRRIQKRILAKPASFDMGTWAREESAAPCGTAACVAGWAVLLTHKGAPLAVAQKLRIGEFGQIMSSRSNAASRGRKALELTQKQADRLFHVDNWPEKFCVPLFGESWGQPSSAKIAAERIDHFIKTNGAE